MLSVGCLMLSMSAGAYAAAAGFYVGGQVGRTNTHNLPKSLQAGTFPIVAPQPVPIVPPTITSTTVTPSNTGVGGRLYVGYNLSEYFAMEMGFTHYASSTYTVPSSPQLLAGNPVGTPTATPGINVNAFDFVAKGMLPIASSGFGVFGKAGVSILKQGMAGTFTSYYNTNIGTTTVTSPNGLISTTYQGSFVKANTTTAFFRPTAAIGAYYDLSQNWQVDFTLSRVFGGGGLQNTDLYSLGFSYHFVDKYCGQFLC